ncbi:MAG: TIGR03915 family putative DNA repair protein, partial [Planctomycetota bacterium]
MRTHSVTDFEKWRAAARACLADGVPPEAVTFGDARAGGLFAFPEQPLAATPATHTVPKAFFGLAEHVACYRDEGRWDLLYRVLWRVTHGEPRLLEVATDDDVHRLTNMRKHVRRDAHKMKAFVRFRRTIETNGDGTETEHFIAWHRPDHYIVKFVAPFFKKRFNGMRWTILTPDDSVGWDLENLTCGPGMPRSAAPAGDDLEDLWKTYYRSTFNPARVKVKAMQAEMPQKQWPTMP